MAPGGTLEEIQVWRWRLRILFLVLWSSISWPFFSSFSSFSLYFFRNSNNLFNCSSNGKSHLSNTGILHSNLWINQIALYIDNFSIYHHRSSINQSAKAYCAQFIDLVSFLHSLFDYVVNGIWRHFHAWRSINEIEKCFRNGEWRKSVNMVGQAS